MIQLLLLVALVQVSGAEDAVRSAELFLRNVGSPPPYNLQSVEPIVRNASTIGYSLSLTDHTGRSFSGGFDAKGRITRMATTTSLSFEKVGTPSANLRTKFSKWLALVKGTRAIGTPIYNSALSGNWTARFPALVSGYPFVASWQRHDFLFAADSKGRFSGFENSATELPPVKSAQPKLTNTQARKALEAAFKRDVAPLGEQGHWKMSYKVVKDPSLGWFLCDGDKTARLVWFFELIVSKESPFGARGGSATMAVDAVSGEHIRSQYLQ